VHEAAWEPTNRVAARNFACYREGASASRSARADSQDKPGTLTEPLNIRRCPSLPPRQPPAGAAKPGGERQGCQTGEPHVSHGDITFD